MLTAVSSQQTELKMLRQCELPLKDNAAPSLRADGLLVLAFHTEAGAQRCRVQLKAQRSPLKFVRAFPHGERGILVHLHNVAGGVLSGDQLQTQCTVGEGCHVLLTSTGATRVYRWRPEDAYAAQFFSAKVATGTLVEYLPDPLILFPGAAFKQSCSWQLAAGARLLCWDIVALGNQNDPVAFTDFQNELRIFCEGRAVATERYALNPKRQLRQTLHFAGRNHLGSFYICDSSFSPAFWLSFEKEVQTALQEWCAGQNLGPDFSFGLSSLAFAGLSFRFLDISAERITLAFAFLRTFLKKRLWHIEDPLPRKIY